MNKQTELCLQRPIINNSYQGIAFKSGLTGVSCGLGLALYERLMGNESIPLESS